MKPLLLFISLVFLVDFSVCFDTGDHFDITEIALRKFGYSYDAIKVVQVTNYLTDVFSQRWFQITKGIQSSTQFVRNKLILHYYYM